MAISGNHILVGLGGTGGKILRAFKMRMYEEFPTKAERSKIPVSLVYVDSTDEMMPQDGRPRPDFRVMGQDASFTKNEFLNIKEVDVEYILDHINNYPNLKGIVDNVGAIRTAIGSLGQAAGQKRRAGRLLFAANAGKYVAKLQEAYAKAEAVSGIGDPERLVIHIFAGLSGGTGSGSIIDAIVQARKNYPEAKILVYVMMPERHLPKPKMDKGRYYQNGYAALNELNALQSGRWNPHDVTGKGPAKLFSARIKGVADGITIYTNVNENGLTVNSLEELPKIIGDYIFARIFYINPENEIYHDILRAYNFENIDDFALEFDEIGQPDENGQIPAARTKKLNSFGIKRVMYPELRVLKHITYTTAKSILYQFKFNNWNGNKGFINEERNKDYRKAYLDKDNLYHWMLDFDHLTLDSKILPSDTDYPSFQDYWHRITNNFADKAKEKADPLNELDNILSDFYKNRFREEGVEKYFENKEKVIPEMVKEIRSQIEKELFEKWKQGEVSLVELQKVSDLLIETVDKLRTDIEDEIIKENDAFKEIDEERKANVLEWSKLSLAKRVIGESSRIYGRHKLTLTDYYESKTRIIALEFAKKLLAKLKVEIGNLNTDISAFGQVLTEAVDATEKLIMAQQKVNKGLEDISGAIIEVSEEELMQKFEIELQIDKNAMQVISNNIREQILGNNEFSNFGKLATEIVADKIINVFDIELAKIVRTKHNERAEAQNKVLGLNILSQLQQKLRTEDDIKKFAHDIAAQSGRYLKLDPNQLQLHLRNNEDYLSPSNPASINIREVLVSIPSPDENEAQKNFADRLEAALKESFAQNITFTRDSPRKDELSIITVGCCFPMRAIDWMAPYKEKYETFLNSGNPNTDASNSILLYSEGNGEGLPSLYAVDNAEEIAAAQATKPEPKNSIDSVPGPSTDSNKGGTVPPPPPPQAEIEVHLAVGGVTYGPFNYNQCKEMVSTKQLTKETLVWYDGLSGWVPAGDAPKLKNLFAPAVPPVPPAVPGGIPPVPPMPPVQQ